MPYKSAAQRRFFNSPGAKKAGISKATVKEFNSESRAKKLPERSLKHTRLPRKAK